MTGATSWSRGDWGIHWQWPSSQAPSPTWAGGSGWSGRRLRVTSRTSPPTRQTGTTAWAWWCAATHLQGATESRVKSRTEVGFTSEKVSSLKVDVIVIYNSTNPTFYVLRNLCNSCWIQYQRLKFKNVKYNEWTNELCRQNQFNKSSESEDYFHGICWNFQLHGWFSSNALCFVLFLMSLLLSDMDLLSLTSS